MARKTGWEWILSARARRDLILFATIALTTFLAGAPPAWMQTGRNAVIAYWGWRLSGPTYVVLGALAALVHSTGGSVAARRCCCS